MANFKLTQDQAGELDTLVGTFESAKSALAEWLEQLAADWEADWDDKSERWQESERGQEARERVDQLRSWFDELPGEGEPNIDVQSLT